MSYHNNFVHHCEALYNKIQENGTTIQECLNIATTALSDSGDIHDDIYEPLWFIYYMFFAIHNPKMEDYIQKKSTTGGSQNPHDIINNMLKRRTYTSTIVFQLYTHAYTNQGNVTHIYPKYKNNILIKSFRDNHLKTTAVLLRRATTTTATATAIVPTDVISAFLEYIITTQPTNLQSTTAIVNKINTMNYKRKDIILLALACYMKVDESEINKKNIFITATVEELNLKGFNYT